MDPNTGQTYLLTQEPERKRALEDMEKDTDMRLVEVEAEEIERLKKLPRAERRKALKGRRGIAREELRAEIFNQEKS